MIHKMKLRKLCSIVIIILIFLKTLFNIAIISTQSKKSDSYEYLVNKVLDDKSFDLWDGLDKSNDVKPFQSGLKY